MKLDSLPLASMPEPEREPATDETNGGGAGLLAALMWGLVLLVVGLAVAGMMAAGSSNQF